MDTSSWGQMLIDYDTAMRAAGRAAGTIRLHRYRVLDVAALVSRPADVTTEHLLQLLARGQWKPETRRSYRGSLRSFFRWAHGTGRLPHDPSEALPTITVPAPSPRPIPQRELERALLTATERERFMVLLAAYAGLRAAEVASVHESWWDGYVLTVTGKGQKVRRVPVVHAELRRRLDGVEGWAFPNGRGSHLTPGHVTRLVSAALPDGWTAHPCRHRYATTAHAGTRDLLAVGRLLGHSRPETTQRYVLLDDDALWAAARAAAA